MASSSKSSGSISSLHDEKGEFGQRQSQRVVIMVGVRCGDAVCDIHRKLVQVFGDMAFSKMSVCRWKKKIEEGRTNFKDEHRSGRPRSVNTTINHELVVRMVQEFPSITLRDLEDKLDIEIILRRSRVFWMTLTSDTDARVIIVATCGDRRHGLFFCDRNIKAGDLNFRI